MKSSNKRGGRLGRWLAGLLLATAALGAMAQDCSNRLRITLGDGSASCLTDHAVSRRSSATRPGTVASMVPGSGLYAVAVSPALAHCPPALGFASLSSLPTASGAGGIGAESLHARSALAECQMRLPSSAPADCACQVVLVDGTSTLPPAVFARYAGAPGDPVARPAPATQPEATGKPEVVAKVEAPPKAEPVARVEPPARPTAVTRPAPAAQPGPDVGAPQMSRASAPAASPAVAAATGEELAELRRQLAQLQAQMGQAQAQSPRAPPSRAAPEPVARKSARALVIGNGAYQHLGLLPNPRRDATDIAAKLRSFGIEVDLVLDADRNALVKALADHQRKAEGLDVNILFYAGHGLQVGGINYIAPVDMLADGISSGYVKLNGVALNDALEYLPARTRLVFLDACRDNPAIQKIVATRTVASPGLAPMTVTSGTLISYATRDGSVAEDGKGRNSPYTAALLRHIDAPDDIAVVLRRVRLSVMQSTGNRQEPWEYGSLVGDQLVLSRLVR